MSTRRRNNEPRKLYLWYSGASAFFFALIATVNLVYQAQVVGLNPLQLMLVGALLEAVVFVCEVPLGVLADVYSRRLSIVIGVTLYGLGFLLEGLVPRFWAILLAQVVWGVGATFVSGAEEAWITSELGPERVGATFFQGAMARQLATLLGIGGSVALASVQLNLPIVIGASCFLVLAMFLAVVMPEQAFQRAPASLIRPWRSLQPTFREATRAVRARPLVVTLIGIVVCYGVAGEGFDRLWQTHLARDLTLPAIGSLQPVVWFGVMSAGALPLSLVATHLASTRLDTTRHGHVAWMLGAITVARAVSAIVFAFATTLPVALVAFWVTTAVRGFGAPLLTTWLSQQITTGARATIFSMSGQADALGQIAGGPVVGWIGTVSSLRAALLASSAALLPAAVLVIRAHGQASEGRILPESTEVPVAR